MSVMSLVSSLYYHSSGTTEGRQKYVPFTCHSSQTTLQIFRLSAAYRARFLFISCTFNPLKKFFTRSPVLVQVLSNKGRREDS